MVVLRILLIFFLYSLQNCQNNNNTQDFSYLITDFKANISKCLSVSQPTALSNCSYFGNFCCLISSDKNTIKSCFAMADYHFFHGNLDFSQNGTTVTINCASTMITVTLIFLVFIF